VGAGEKGWWAKGAAYNKTAHMTRVAKQLQKGVGLKEGFGHAKRSNFY